MVDVHALEDIAKQRELGKSAITNRPVGQQSGECREDVKCRATASRIGAEESRDEHVARIRIDPSHSDRRAVSIQHIGPCAMILCLHPSVELGSRSAEPIERSRMIAVRGIAHALEGTANRDGGHVERAIQRGGRTSIHELHALRPRHGARCREVNLQVAYRFKRSLQLQVLSLRTG